MNPQTIEAIRQLLEDHTILYEGQPVEREALIQSLTDARYSPISDSSGGASSGSMSLVNQKAVELYDDIQGEVTRLYRLFKGAHFSIYLTAGIARWFETIQAAHAGNILTDIEREEYEAMPCMWVTQIELLLDPPHVKEILEPCPRCEKRYYYDADSRTAAVTITVKPGYALIAECSCCGALWAGEQQLMELANSIGIEPDIIGLRKAALFEKAA